MSKFFKRSAAFLLCLVLMFNLCGTALAAVKITTQPKNVSVGYGETAKVSVKASGDGLTYLWYYANKGSDTFKKSSVTSRAYSVTMNEDRDGRRVYCLVKDSDGNKKKSDIVTLSLEKKTLAINTQPKNVSVAPGETAKVSVSATGDGLSYTWYTKDAGASDFVKSSITKSYYSVTMNDTRDGRQLYCVVADAYGNKLTSDTVTMKQVKTLAEITAQPESVTVASGEKAAVSVKAIGDGITYTWYTKDAGATKFTKSSITAASYSVTMNDTRDGRQLYCVVTDAYGNSVTSDTVTMEMLKIYAEITAQPEDVSVAPGATAKISVEAIGDGITYTWYTKDAGATKFTKSSITKSYYSVTMNDTRDGREVYCVVTDTYGNSVTSETATMYQVKVEAEITKQPESVTVAEGDKATITVEAIGDGITYTWYTKDRTGTSFAKSSITASSYSVTMNASRHGRQVYCVVKDAYGNTVTSETATMSMIIPELVITKQPESVTVAPGEKAAVSVEATGDGLTYAWYTKDKTADEFVKSSITKSSYSVTMNASRHGRELYCVITDEYGQTVQTETVKMEMVITPLAITAQPQSVVVAEGETAAVTVEATGDGLTYAWYYAEQGSDTFKLTTSFKTNTYSVSMTELRSGRRVYCVVTDDYGDSVTSEIATLSMKGKLELTKNIPASCYYLNNYPFTFTAEATGDGVTYAWYSAAPESDEFVLVGEENTYSLTMAPELDGTRVYFVATDAYGETVQSRTCVLNLRIDLEITTQPVSVAVLDGEEAVVTFEAVGNELTYAWYYAAPGSDEFKLTTTFTSNEYSITMNEDRDGRQVYCVVTDMFGKTVQTETVTLSIRPELAFTKNLPKSINLPNGMPYDFTVTAEGTDVTYAWYSAAPDSETFELVGEGDTYTTSVTPETDGMRIYCIATDAYGDTVQSNICPLYVRYDLEIVTQPVSVTVLEGEEAVVTFEAVGNDLTYAWYYAAPGSDEFKLTTSFTSNEYKVTMTKERDGRQVYCVVTDKWNESVQTDIVTLSIKPPVEYEEAEDGTIAITSYIGTEADLVIPSVIDGKTVTAIAPSAFKDNTVLITITLPTTVTSIGDNAFENCTSLTVVTLSDNVETIGVAAFKNCTSLASMVIDND